MARQKDGWDVSAVVWEDACTSIEDPTIGTVPTISFGIVVPDQKRRLVRVVHDITAMNGGSPGALTAIHQHGMAVRRVFLGRLAIPDEFRKYWGESEDN